MEVNKSASDHEDVKQLMRVELQAKRRTCIIHSLLVVLKITNADQKAGNGGNRTQFEESTYSGTPIRYITFC